VIGTEVLSRFEDAGYSLALEGEEIRASGPTAPPEELRTLAEENRDVLKAAILLSDPPDWLAKLFNLYWSGHKSPVKLTTLKGAGTQARLDFGEPEEARKAYPENLRGGKTEVYMVSVSIKNIAAAVAAEIGMSVLEWERIRPEVEEALGTWKSGAA
jgi:hypothetical protein